MYMCSHICRAISISMVGIKNQRCNYVVEMLCLIKMFEVKIEYKEAWEMILVSYVKASGVSYDILGSLKH